MYILSNADQLLLNLIRFPGSDEYKVQGRSKGPLEYGSYVDLFGRFPRAGTHLFGEPVVQLIKSPVVQVVDANLVTDEGRECLEVKLVSGVDEPKMNIVLRFDPHAGWLVRSGRYDMGPSDPNAVTFMVTYADTSEAIPFPKLVAFRSSIGEDACEFLAWEPGSSPPEEFDPASYGQPRLRTQSGSHWPSPYHWVGAAALTLLVFAWGIRRATRVRRSP